MEEYTAHTPWSWQDMVREAAKNVLVAGPLKRNFPYGRRIEHGVL